jgi:hypothetical protein
MAQSRRHALGGSKLRHVNKARDQQIEARVNPRCPFRVPTRHVQILTRQPGSSIMFDSNRRAFLGALALGAGGLAATRSLADDGSAAGYDVTPASNFMQTVPRKSGDPLKFSFPLDSGPIKATSEVGRETSTARASRSRLISAVPICSSIRAARARCIGTIPPNGP